MKKEKLARTICANVTTLVLFAIITALSTTPDEFNGLADKKDHDLDTFTDLLYFNAVSFTTTGFGDIYPKSKRAKLLVSLFLLSVNTMLLYGLYTTFHEYPSPV